MKIFLYILTYCLINAVIANEIQLNNFAINSYDIPTKCGKCGKHHLPGVPCSPK